MNTQNNINTQVQAVATEVINDIKAVKDLGEIVTPVFLHTLIELNTTSLSFENNTTEGLFSTLVLNSISKLEPELYSEMFPPVGMAANGSWTKNVESFA